MYQYVYHVIHIYQHKHVYQYVCLKNHKHTYTMGSKPFKLIISTLRSSFHEY